MRTGKRGAWSVERGAWRVLGLLRSALYALRLTLSSGAVRRLAASLALAAVWPLAAAGAQAADPDAPAELVVTDKVLRPAEKVPPLGPNGWGGCGAVEWAANNFVHNAGNEPIYWRNLHRVKECGPTWFEIDGPGTSWWDLWASGFLSGASLRLYRIVDKDGKPLPPNKQGSNLDLATADHVVFVGSAQVLPEGSPGFPDGGWVATRYGDVYPNAWIRHGNLTCTDASGLVNGRTHWYVVVAVSADGKEESEHSNEASATPQAGLDTPPHILIPKGEDQLPSFSDRGGDTFTPKVHGGQPPCRWEAVDDQDKPLALPGGMILDPATGTLAGKAKGQADDFRLHLRVTDAKGRSDTRAYLLNPGPKEPVKGKPEPPQALTAAAGDGCVTLSWKASPSANLSAYRLKRSTAPAAKQEMKVYLSDGAPKLEKWDYAVIEKRFGNFDMRHVHPRVRGIGNPANHPGWYWHADLDKISFSLVPHPKPVPAEMLDPGETCMQAKAGPGDQTISQIVFIGTQHGGESLWYGQLEPGKHYRLEVWLRQEGLGRDGEVTFSYGRGYPDIRKSLQVTGHWGKFTHEFDGPERPKQPLHFGHTFSFTGPGTLWMDNCRIFRADPPASASAPDQSDRSDPSDRGYSPNPTVLDELLKAQPESGPKAAHRIWFLSKDATMASILSWHASSDVRPDWRTAVGRTMEMTLPMGLLFDLATGKDAASRMRPWLVLQHILHTEQDWLSFIEYLAAPYDPKADTPQAKPWAYKRFQQRGVGTPWTDEFPCLIVEFGNETWHNGIFDDWIGFSTRNAVHQGGKEYGLFTRYLIENMRKSPYWKSQGLDRKIRFALGANYDGRVDKDGAVRGYGEEAMQANPMGSVLGHANYVGPKWETGDYSARVYDDHGVQECLLSFLTGPEGSQVRMRQAREALAKSHHEYDIAAYEGGPGGFALPGRGSREQVETNERYGKSLAQAVGAFDAWMRSYAYGWTDQCYLGYGQGTHWNSHGVFADGFRPGPAWLALALRNRYASGDLVAVEERSVPTLQRRKDVYPLIGGYAMRDKDRWSVFVVSRKLDGQHDNHDFGDGHTPVTLRVPFASAAKIALHTLTGDPRLTNREKMNIQVESKQIPAEALDKGTLVINERTGGSRAGLPPGSIFLYVFEGAR